MPDLGNEPKFNAVMKSSASRLVPLGTSNLSLCTFKLNV